MGNEHSKSSGPRPLPTATEAEAPPTYEEAVLAGDAPGASTSTVTSLDPLVAALLHNKARSPMYRLPSPILNQIVKLLDVETRSRLRHTSSLFFNFATQLAKPVQPAAPAQNGSFASVYKRLPNLCTICTLATFQPDFEKRCAAAFETYLYCNWCGLEHQAWLFSPAQRNVDFDSVQRRWCIAFEGRLRLCAHKAVQLGELGSVGRVPPPEPGSDITNIRTLVSCSHPSHKTTCCGSEPMVEERVHADGRRDLIWRWYTNIPTLPDREPTARHLRHQLGEMRRTVGGYIVPPNTPGDLPELRCIDPRNCGCVRYEGSELLPPEGVPAWWRQRNCKPAPQTTSGSIREALPFAKTHKAIASTSRSKKALTRYVVFDPCPKTSNRGFSCISVEWAARFPVSRNFESWMYDWCAALDPSSYGGCITNDSDFRNITWCISPGCMNYLRSDWRFRKPRWQEHSRG
ncbi:hypothetical protein GGTG_11939 [Gaeumannomyces tritici R3-111a-1]|uniref:F-box domain-containing protein n=1 Tax=Gaeumannomyces tritici (strain R3-111a-1) TaxID=644352 RepID=J3PEK8_GAET3|nr:hypothetical protein GGTG_11939 [Gaeumannomyces tritici R3-111a-1]EJT70916.1 hypothetical protein GGTG_11939 [Gaeumannomyces tritici R3-111a-1]